MEIYWLKKEDYILKMHIWNERSWMRVGVMTIRGNIEIIDLCKFLKIIIWIGIVWFWRFINKLLNSLIEEIYLANLC